MVGSLVNSNQSFGWRLEAYWNENGAFEEKVLVWLPVAVLSCYRVFWKDAILSVL